MTHLRSIIRNTLLFVNLLSVLLFLVSCLAPYISPEKFWPVAFIGFGFIPLLLTNVAWIVFWLVFKWRFSFFSIAAVLICWWNISNHFNFSGCPKPSKQGSLSLMTFNVKVFNLYDWNHNTTSKEVLLQLISNANPDIVCLQEFYTDSENFNTVTILKKTYPYFHFHKTLTLDTYHHWGIATFSKFPIVNRDSIIFNNVKHNLAISSDIVFNSDTVRVFNAHLQSIYFGTEEYEGMKHLQKKSEVEFVFWRIFDKLKKAFIKRASQADLLAKEISKSSYKVLVCTDFNDTPNSYTYRTVSKGLTDSFKEAGCVMGRTYSKPLIFRIDYILADQRFQFVSHKVIWNNESDHYAVKASLELK